MNRLTESLRLLPEALIDPAWPQKALALRRKSIPTPDIATALNMPEARVREVLADPDRIVRAGIIMEWSHR